MTIFRRNFLLWLFMFWQGGFLFYGAVVVTIGSEIHGDFGQGLITRGVAEALNRTGLLVLIAWAGDLILEPDTCLKRRIAVWLFLLLSLAVLHGLHSRMEALIDPQAYRLLDPDAFHHLHRWYLRISTVQWLASLLFTYWTLQNWRAADRSSMSPVIQAPG